MVRSVTFLLVQVYINLLSTTEPPAEGKVTCSRKRKACGLKNKGMQRMVLNCVRKSYFHNGIFVASFIEMCDSIYNGSCRQFSSIGRVSAANFLFFLNLSITNGLNTRMDNFSRGLHGNMWENIAANLHILVTCYSWVRHVSPPMQFTQFIKHAHVWYEHYMYHI